MQWVRKQRDGDEERMAGYKVMIVEDDEVIADMVCSALEKWDFTAVIARDFKNIALFAAEEQPDLILLDINLPFYNGFYWCSKIREASKVPVVFLSSADDNMNIVMAMNMGGDDFIAKPFDMNVLIAKINAVLRRSYAYPEQSSVITAEGLVLNLADASVAFRGERAELTKNELRILKLFMEQAGKMVSRDTIMTYLWDDEEFVDDNTLTVNITRIRKKLKQIGADEMIRTKKGIGYLLKGEE